MRSGFVLSRREFSPVLSVVFGTRVSKSVSKISGRNHTGLRTDHNSSRGQVTRCDAGTAAYRTGVKARPRATGTAGAYGSQARARPCRRRRSSW